MVAFSVHTALITPRAMTERPSEGQELASSLTRLFSRRLSPSKLALTCMTITVLAAVQLFSESVCTCHTMWYLTMQKCVLLSTDVSLFKFSILGMTFLN